MKRRLLSLVLLASATLVNAQTTAVNWTATDCNSVSHTLHNELNNGKVIVLTWVMPCASCVNPAKTAYNVVQGFAGSNPGQVLFYMADDLGDHSCSSLSSWVTSNSIGNLSNMTLFSNSGNVINENDFGGTGMPHTVVIGGPNHQIFFNKKNSSANDATGIQNAINAALGSLSIGDLNNQISFSVSPNPIREHCTINYGKEIKTISLFSVTGQFIREENFDHGKINPTINLSSLSAGMYLIRITDKEDKTGFQKVVKE